MDAVQYIFNLSEVNLNILNVFLFSSVHSRTKCFISYTDIRAFCLSAVDLHFSRISILQENRGVVFVYIVYSYWKTLFIQAHESLDVLITILCNNIYEMFKIGLCLNLIKATLYKLFTLTYQCQNHSNGTLTSIMHKN